MALFNDIDAQVAVLRDLFGGDVAAEDLTSRMASLGGETLVKAVAAAAALVRSAERVGIVGAGIVAVRSRREAGQDGLAQRRGHRSPAALIQEITGTSHADAQRQVRLGQSILDSDATGGGLDGKGAGADGADFATGGGPDAGGAAFGMEAGGSLAALGDGVLRAPWHAPLSAALLAGRIPPAQQDAIQRGLGHPIDDTADTHAAWSAAAEQLIADAAARTVEELRIQARAIRDQLDPEGAQRRFTQRYERRSFRIWIDADGIEHGRIEFEDDGATWVRTIRDAALRPRRGGPRFVDSSEARKAADLTADARTNDQLGYDLLIDLLRAGALADATTVFGTRQAGVRIVAMIDDAGTLTSARTEDYGHPLPPPAIDKRICDTGAVHVSVDRTGNPLDVGREHRLFTPRQRIALAIRDGGCRWRGCDRPASYCEAHHIDEWHRDFGRTDIDRGILLCWHHHMQLHHGRWRITRHGADDFVLHPPDYGPPIPLRPRAALTATWAGIGPPPRRFRPGAA